MNIRETLDGDSIILHLDGSFDEMSSQSVEERLETVFAGETGNILLDLKKVKYISSAGIRVLIMAHKKALKTGKVLLIAEMSDKVEEILQMVGILPLFSIDRYRGHEA